MKSVPTKAEGYDQMDNLVLEHKVHLKLPDYEQFNTNYPEKDGGLMPANEVFNLIGGKVLDLANEHGYTNACAARGSRALVYSGLSIPHIANSTFEGRDGKFYFLSAQKYFEWIKQAFGPASFALSQGQCKKDGSGFRAIVGQKKGLYIMIPNYPARFGASGHADIYDGNSFNGDGYFNIDGDIYRAYLWEMV